jgi:hypothetical protein
LDKILTASVVPAGNIIEPVFKPCAGGNIAQATGSVTTTRRSKFQEPLEGQGRAEDCTAHWMEPLGNATTKNSTASILIPKLASGLTYWVRVLGVNDVGKSAASHSGPRSYAAPAAPPDVPTSATLTVNTNSSLRVQYAPPDRTLREGNEGAKVRNYTIEFGTRVSEQQLVTVKASRGPITAGQFALKFDNNGVTRTTRCLDWNALPSTVERLLEELDNVDDVSVIPQRLAPPPLQMATPTRSRLMARRCATAI